MRQRISSRWQSSSKQEKNTQITAVFSNHYEKHIVLLLNLLNLISISVIFFPFTEWNGYEFLSEACSVLEGLQYWLSLVWIDWKVKLKPWTITRPIIVQPFAFSLTHWKALDSNQSNVLIDLLLFKHIDSLLQNNSSPNFCIYKHIGGIFWINLIQYDFHSPFIHWQKDTWNGVSKFCLVLSLASNDLPIFPHIIFPGKYCSSQYVQQEKVDWTKDFPVDCLVFCFLLLFALAIRRRREQWHNLTRQAFQHECTQCLITSLPGQLVLILLWFTFTFLFDGFANPIPKCVLPEPLNGGTLV